MSNLSTVVEVNVTPTPEQIAAAQAILELVKKNDEVSKVVADEATAESTSNDPATPEVTTITKDENPALVESEVTTSNDEAIAQPEPPTIVRMTVEITAEEFEYIQDMKAKKQKDALAKRIKDLGIDYSNRRNTLILRRAQDQYPDLVQPEEVFAYCNIYDLKKEVADPKSKIRVSDSEIAKFIELQNSGIVPTLSHFPANTEADNASDDENEDLTVNESEVA